MGYLATRSDWGKAFACKQNNDIANKNHNFLKKNLISTYKTGWPMKKNGKKYQVSDKNT